VDTCASRAAPRIPSVSHVRGVTLLETESILYQTEQTGPLNARTLSSKCANTYIQRHRNGLSLSPGLFTNYCAIAIKLIKNFTHFEPGLVAASLFRVHRCAWDRGPWEGGTNLTPLAPPAACPWSHPPSLSARSSAVSSIW
jgi:hypothetical protein